MPIGLQRLMPQGVLMRQGAGLGAGRLARECCCGTECCGVLIPDTLTVTISGFTDPCAVLVNGSYNMLRTTPSSAYTACEWYGETELADPPTDDCDAGTVGEYRLALVGVGLTLAYAGTLCDPEAPHGWTVSLGWIVYHCTETAPGVYEWVFEDSGGLLWGTTRTYIKTSTADPPNDYAGAYSLYAKGGLASCTTEDGSCTVA
jgi:hypothetical protein